MPSFAPSRSLLASALVLGALSCAPWPEFPESDCDGEPCGDGSSTGDPPTASITITDPWGGSRDSEGGTDSGTGTSTDSDSDSDTESSTTEGADEEPPAILDLTLTPSTITKNGVITVDVSASQSDGVRLRLDDGSVHELVQTEPGHFSGPFSVLTGLANGTHSAKVVPRREGVEGLQAKADYTVDLPELGSELHWEASDSLLLGRGWVVAMGNLPSGELVELGTRIDDDKKRRCYMRKRTTQGAWGSPDVVELLPGDECEAIDLVIREDGTIHALLSWKIAPNAWGWWLSDIPAWGNDPITLAAGPAGQDAKALAYSDGALAVCGSAPSGHGDVDAFVDLVGDGEGPRWLDYLPDDGLPEDKHTFDESPADCRFLDGELVALVGDAYGKHIANEAAFSRRFLATIDLNVLDELGFAVTQAGFTSQSFATAVDLSGSGEVLVAGYTCGQPCSAVEGMVWTLSPQGDELSASSVGLFADPILAPQALKWSIAGYVLLSHGGYVGDDESFIVDAFAPGSYSEPLWSYTRHDPFQTHIPLALTVGRFGEVFAGGLGEQFPAVAYIGG